MDKYLKQWYVNEEHEFVFAYSDGSQIILTNQYIKLVCPNGGTFVYSPDKPLKAIKEITEQAIAPQWQKNFMQKFMKGE